MNRIKVFRVIIIIIPIVLAILIFKPRGYKKMERIANSELRYLLQREQLNKTIKDFQRIPLRETEDKSALIFTWLYLLETGDTAAINIKVKKQVYPWGNRESEIYMNSKWSYLKKTKKSILEVLPLKYKGDSLYSARSVSYLQSDEYFDNNDTLKLLVSTEKLFSYLKAGYYNVLKRYENYTVIAFYEPIAQLTNGNRKSPTMTAKVFFNDRYEVFIIPYDAPQELWDNYNKE